VPRLFRFLAAVLFIGSCVSGIATAGEIYEWKGGATPKLALPTLAGSSANLDAMKGRVVLVNFWATWCEPCVAEMPSLDTLRKNLGPNAVEVFGVNLGETPSRVSKFAEKLNIQFPILLDRDGVAKRDWGVGGVPVTFVIGGDGRIAFRIVGEADFSEPKLLARLRPLMTSGASESRNTLSMR
jgi:thiol-disulfide isomerase/thioredoxin